MAIADKTQYWTSRLNGDNPESPTSDINNQVWTKSGTGGSATTDGYWTITSNQTFSITPTTNSYTIVAALYMDNGSSIPSNGTVLLSLDNGTHKVEVRSKGNRSKLDLVGASTVTTHDLDLGLAEDEPTTLILRLTLEDGGAAKLYMREIIEDDDGATHFLSVTGASGSSKSILWGNANGSVKWGSVYASTHGAFSPEELMTSDFAQDTLARMGLSIVERLRDCNRLYLKTQVEDSSIVYGYDISSEMVNRIAAPAIHVLVKGIESPSFDALGGGRIIQEYDVLIFVTTRGTNYSDAYRSCLNIVGEVFDELYTKTGLSANTDSIVSYAADLDTKRDDDETVCVHTLTMRYMRRINMRTR